MARGVAAPGGRYGRVAIAFHWTIALLVIVNLALGLLHEQFAGPVRDAMIGVHKSIGITVLALSVGRVAWRLTHRAPPLPAYVAWWERALSRGVQSLFYILIFTLPITGWWMGSAGPRPRPVSWFGLFTLPPLPVTGGGDATHNAHVLMGWVMLGLVVLHVTGALRHQLVRRDAVLDRMWPGIAPR